MSPSQTIKTAAIFAVAILVAFAILNLLAKLAVGVLKMLYWALPFLLAVAAVVSCAKTRKPENVKILWMIVVIALPVVGPLLWFVWGKENT